MSSSANTPVSSRPRRRTGGVKAIAQDFARLARGDAPRPVYPVYKTLRERIAAEKAERQAAYAVYAQALGVAAAGGRIAGNTCSPVPMEVGAETRPFSGVIDRSKPTYVVADGVCGFAWVHVAPGSSRFARWLVANGHATANSYSGGVSISIHDHGQSLARKEAHAQAFAKLLRERLTDAGLAAGLRITARSQID